MSKTNNTTLFSQLYKQMKAIGLITTNNRFIQDCSLVSPGYMNLFIENLNGAYRDESGRSQAVYMMCHCYLQNGDNMYDPCVEFGIDFRNERVYPLVLKTDSVNQHVDVWISGDLDIVAEKEIGLFMKKWISNINKQGFTKELKKAV